MSLLFQPFTIKSVTLKNRLVVSPMCQYSSADGFMNDWHLVHLGSRAVGGAGLIFTEAAAVSPGGRISPQDLGIYKDEHIEGLRRITRFLEGQGTVPGIQLAHAGRKASTRRPWEPAGIVPESEGGWESVAPSAIPFHEADPAPQELDAAGIAKAIADFAAAARRALSAGFKVIELHAAHGYLIHEFLSPITNKRTDQYGGSFDNRIRFLLEIIAAVQEAWPADLPVIVRISATDWAPDGWTDDDSVALATILKTKGIDLIDCSTGGIASGIRIKAAPLYQVPFAAKVRQEAGIPTGAVGLITTTAEAEAILQNGEADLIFMAREMLRDPYFPQHAAKELGEDIVVPVQYGRAKR